MIRPVVAFHLNVLQDVSAVRPLVRLTGSMQVDIMLLLSPNFAALDKAGIWRAEIERLATETGGVIRAYETHFDIVRLLARRQGLCIAGSESDVRAHRASHDLFRVLPNSIRTITLQHGFECIGFLHNERHTAAYGRNVRFAAEIIVGWFGEDRLRDVASSERGKLYTAGPQMLIDRNDRIFAGDTKNVSDFVPYNGVICENTHSVRFSSQSMKAAFLTQVEDLAERMNALGRTIDLRPHPAGQFIERSAYTPPRGLAISDTPLYKLDLSRYSFAISAPSTVLFDFILAGIPVALWGARQVDTANFAGLVAIDNHEECWQFVVASVMRRAVLLANQQNFVAALQIPANVRERYLGLLALASG